MKSSDIVVNQWGARFLGRNIPCSIGRGGIVDAEAKREGDGATPRGNHELVGVFYNPARLPRPTADAIATGPQDGWSDDSRDPAYNNQITRPHRFSHERLQRPDPLYDLIIATDWNWPDASPGRGSAIFVHSWRRPRFPTAGCVAFAREDLRWIVARLRQDSRLIIL